MSQLKSIAITIHPLNFLLNESLSQNKKKKDDLWLLKFKYLQWSLIFAI